ncbi:exonuclease [Candidatus Kaiserbacteria bacterium RIFCSPHIGHO2_02_FULL_50_50]|uniref:Exonuclease n=1 Tax=Candidatus Kaiserbacteria bacterium RIFCSPHIGHO2_02_FULL_50_50 TaxID=1798492 RepID=A0A1F6DF40_9BACT|nr:MAG: exonuclease [Candidatus Kaiserbacteria bacterium RIFCSPHIGHO2_02_FULL_50_50]OGG88692.1 MAG: exonuclease [Candidatus Kaiserbacteria bacterium RIFCSPLOWO2_12_FULL_50_10]
MTYFVVDIESDGPVPGLYSMISFGAVILNRKLNRTYYGTIRPISTEWIPEALAVSGHTRDETLLFENPEVVMPAFATWVHDNTKSGTKAVFVSDNNGYDFSFMAYYLWRYTGSCVFGHTSRNINDLYRGMQKTLDCSFDHLRGRSLDHNPVRDAIANAEALLKMRQLGLCLKL